METMVEIRELKKQYGDHLVLEAVDLKIKKGEIVGLIGKNGSGKTTLMKMILGFTQKDQGDISFSSEMKKVGYLLDCKFFDYMNGYENLKVIHGYSSGKTKPEVLDKKIRQLLKFVDLAVDNKAVKGYSFGMKQRLGLALALMEDPDLLILDEPFVGLDPVGIESFIRLIKDLSKIEKKTILVSSHQLSEIEQICDRYVLIEKKTLIDVGKADQVKMKIITNGTVEQLNKIFESRIKIAEDGSIIITKDMEVLNFILENVYFHKLKVIDFEIENDGLTSLFYEEGKQ
ncbi:hypothetical protein BCR25_08580 [Enterococcus termitis]|uniref:ABC transporter domain-containing protein n=2 Tax=Enterococcus termitis TaxID=332950 RepID=A0A1E5GDD2_9ENTE|nr:hypothetical protein BCR25_08580 [Enterococcus termitis]